MNVQVKVDLAGAIKLARTVLRQLPYSLRDALNDTAKDFQRAEQNLVLREFNVTQPTFILNSIKVGRDGFARANKLFVTIEINPERNQLAKFERGGVEQSIAGKRYLAIPSRDVKLTKRGAVPRSLYPGRFGPFTDVDRGSVLATGQDRTFIVRSKSGIPVLLQRTGKGKVRAIAIYKPEVNLGPGRLHFLQTAEATARSAWKPNFTRAWARNIATAR